MPTLSTYFEPRQWLYGKRARYALTTLLVTFCFFYGAIFAFLAPYLLVILAVPLVVTATMVIWALPGSLAPPLRSMTTLYFGFFVALFMWPNYLSIALPGLPWISLLRITSVPLACLFLISASVSRDFVRELGRILSDSQSLPRLMLCFVIIQLLSITFSKHVGDSVQQFILDQINWTLIFFVSCYIFSRPGSAFRWTKYLWLMVIVIGVIATAEYHFHRVLWAGHVPGFLKIQDPTVAAIMAGGHRQYTDVYRVQATLSTGLGLSEFLALAFPFVLHIAFSGSDRVTRGAALVSLPFIAIVTLFTNSRSGILGLLLGSMAYVLLWAVRRWRANRQSVLAPAIVLTYPALAVVVLAATIFVHRIRTVVWGGGDTVGSTEARVTQTHMAIPLILKHPWGYGIGQAGETLGFRLPSGLLTIDNYFLVLLLDYGVIGFLVYFGLMFSGIGVGLRRSFEVRDSRQEEALLLPAVVSLCVFTLVKSVFAQQDNHPLVFMILGLIAALAHRVARARGDSEHADRHGLSLGVRVTSHFDRMAAPRRSLSPL